MIDRGTYSAVVAPVVVDGKSVSIQFGKSPKKGTIQAAVLCEILSGPQAGQRISWIGYFTDATVDRTVESLRTFGFVGDELKDFPSQTPDVEVEIVVDHEEYDGKTRAKVLWVNAPGGGGLRMADQMNPTELLQFGARLRSKLKSAPATKGTKAERRPPSRADGEDRGDDPALDGQRGFSQSFSQQDPSPPASDDDIPF